MNTESQNRPLTREDVTALKMAGLEGENWHMVKDPDGRMLALFKSYRHAKEWKQEYCPAGEIEVWPMIIR